MFGVCSTDKGQSGHAGEQRFVVRTVVETSLASCNVEEGRSLAKGEVMEKVRCRMGAVTANRKPAVIEGTGELEDTVVTSQVPAASTASMMGDVNCLFARTVVLTKSKCHDYAPGEVSDFAATAAGAAIAG